MKLESNALLILGGMDIMISVKGLEKTYYKNKKKVNALIDINLEINTGEIVCILGHNGAGKTSLIKCISNLILPNSGEIIIDGNLLSKNPDIAKDKIGAVLEGSRNIYYYLSPEENLRYFGLLNNLSSAEIKEKTELFLKMFDLTDRRKDPVNDFSRGMQQKVAIVVALMKDPSILLLDEPTLGLDITSTAIVKDIIRDLATKLNKTIIITTHDINLIEDLNSRLIFMNKGKIIKDAYLDELHKELSRKDIIEILMENDKFDILKAEVDLSSFTFKREKYYTKLIIDDENWLKRNYSKINYKQINKKTIKFEELYNLIMKKDEQ